MSVLHERAISKIRDNAPNGVMSYQDYCQLMSWLFHLGKRDSNKLKIELKDLGLIQLGNHGFKINQKQEGKNGSI